MVPIYPHGEESRPHLIKGYGCAGGAVAGYEAGKRKERGDIGR